jgi:hypothetical protein
MSEVIGTNTAGIGVSGTGSNYGVYGISTGNFAGVAGVNAGNSTAPGIYAQTKSNAPGILAISGLASFVDAASSTDLDAAASSWAAQYPDKAGLFIGDVVISGALQIGQTANRSMSLAGNLLGTAADFSGAVSIGGKLTGKACDFGDAVNIGGKLTGKACDFSDAVSVGGELTGTTCEFKGNAKTGVHGVNGSGSGTTPKFGCGVWGESDQGYGVYGASKNASGVYGTSGSGGLAGEFVGNVSVTGHVKANDVVLSGADCAEEFDVAADLEPGTVTVLDDDGALRACVRAYDRRVAGVISGAGEFAPAIVLDRRQSSRRRAPVALVGKVYCKVDASNGPIEVGDLLTTSATPGHAMRAADPAQAFGSIIGKALKPLSAGRGLLPILVALQ